MWEYTRYNSGDNDYLMHARSHKYLDRIKTSKGWRYIYEKSGLQDKARYDRYRERADAQNRYLESNTARMGNHRAGYDDTFRADKWDRVNLEEQRNRDLSKKYKNAYDRSIVGKIDKALGGDAKRELESRKKDLETANKEYDDSKVVMEKAAENDKKIRKLERERALNDKLTDIWNYDDHKHKVDYNKGNMKAITEGNERRRYDLKKEDERIRKEAKKIASENSKMGVGAKDFYFDDSAKKISKRRRNAAVDNKEKAERMVNYAQSNYDKSVYGKIDKAKRKIGSAVSKRRKSSQY